MAQVGLRELLEAGVQILLRPGPFVHSKLLIVDRAWARIGSSNLDNRSFHLNYELDISVVGSGAVEQAIAAWERLTDGAYPVNREQMQSRGLVVRAWQNLWRLWGPML